MWSSTKAPKPKEWQLAWDFLSCLAMLLGNLNLDFQTAQSTKLQRIASIGLHNIKIQRQFRHDDPSLVNAVRGYHGFKSLASLLCLFFQFHPSIPHLFSGYWRFGTLQYLHPKTQLKTRIFRFGVVFFNEKKSFFLGLGVVCMLILLVKRERKEVD